MTDSVQVDPGCERTAGDNLSALSGRGIHSIIRAVLNFTLHLAKQNCIHHVDL